jgi:hypothetical protein
MPVILAAQKTEIRRITVQSQRGQIVHPNLEKTHHKKKTVQVGVGALVEWLKM